MWHRIRVAGIFGIPILLDVSSLVPFLLIAFLFGWSASILFFLSLLAHELGHGVHQVLAAPNGALMAPTPLTLAETASVFGEMLTFRRLLDRTTDPVQRKAMLAAKVEDMLNTVVRQIAFYAFERKVHLERRNGELTADKLCELWMSVQGDSLGPSIRLGPGYETFWTYIPHFIHSPFYVYAYTFGEMLALALYRRYQTEGRRSCRAIWRCWPPAARSRRPSWWRRSGSI